MGKKEKQAKLKPRPKLRLQKKERFF